MSTEPYYTDRSRVISFQVCPRMRYWRNEYGGGRGIVPLRNSVPLTVGSATHKGLEHLLLGDDVEIAVRHADLLYLELAQERNLDLAPEEDEGYTFHEQRALIEALIRAWNLARKPSFLSTYEVVEVEREEEFELAPGIVFMARPDALLRHRQTGELYILSIKTASTFSSVDEQRARYDVQGLSELAAVESRLAEEWHQDWQHRCAVEGCEGEVYEQHRQAAERKSPRIAGIHYEYLIKGQRRKDDKTGQYVQDTPLIRPWMKRGVVGQEDEFAWKYWFTDPMTGGNRNIGRSYSRVNIWEHISVREWVDLLHAGVVQSEMGDPFGPGGILSTPSQPYGLFYAPVPYYRNQEDVENWRKQTEIQEARLARIAESGARVAVLRSEGRLIESEEDRAADDRLVLNKYFPQYRHSCIQYNSNCSYVPLCFNNEDPNPETSMLYAWRVPHHAAELERHERLYQIEGVKA